MNKIQHQNTDGKYTVHDRVRYRVYSTTPSATLAPDDPNPIIPVDAFAITDGIRINRFLQEEINQEDMNSPNTFQEYIRTLPEHERLLLQHCDILTDDIHTMCAKIQHLNEVLIVSDGGAAEDFGSFGWVMGLWDGTRLAQGSGVVYGHDPKSYRAEAHGAKASSLFMLHALEYCKHLVQDHDRGFHYYCDNEGLLKKLEVFRKYNNAVTANCLKSEWDIVSSIHTTHTRFQWPPFLYHVKGHQDDHHDLEDLDLPTIMNIEADALATQALTNGKSQPIIPFDPATGAMLSIDSKAITRHIETTIQRHEHTGPILQ